MPIYEVRGPDGRRFEIRGAKPPSPAELQSMFAQMAPEPAAQSPEPAEGGSKVFGMTPGPELADLDVIEPHGGPMLPPIPRAAVAAITGSAGMGRVWETAKAAAEQAAPAVKYEATKSALEAINLPSPLAIAIATVVSGAKRSGRAPQAATPTPPPAPSAPAPRVPANATSTQWGHVSPASVLPKPAAAPVAPAASTPAAPAPAVAPVPRASAPPPPAAPARSPQRIRNEVGLAERRAGLKLTEAQRTEADRLVAQGQAPLAAVRSVAGPAPAASAPTPTAAPAPAASTAARPRLSAAETQAFQRLRAKGKTAEEAYAAIELQRGLAARLGTPSPEKARQAVVERNKTGRWKSE